MRSPLCALLVLLALAAPAFAEEDPLAAIERRQQELFKKVGPSVVFISSANAFGSGFFVREDGMILTNAHVVRRHPVKVVLSSGATYTGRLLRDPPKGVDLALVKIDMKGARTLPLLENPSLKVGTWVASVGHGEGGIWSFNSGLISNIYPRGKGRPVFQTQIPLNPGSSGGPVVDRQGRVIGIVTAGIKGSNSINFAIRTEVVVSTFPHLKSSCDCLVITAPAGVPVFVDGKMVGSGPRVTHSPGPGKHKVFAVIKGKMTKKIVSYPRQRLVELR